MPERVEVAVVGPEVVATALHAGAAVAEDEVEAAVGCEAAGFDAEQVHRDVVAIRVQGHLRAGKGGPGGSVEGDDFSGESDVGIRHGLVADEGVDAPGVVEEVSGDSEVAGSLLEAPQLISVPGGGEKASRSLEEQVIAAGPAEIGALEKLAVVRQSDFVHLALRRNGLGKASALLLVSLGEAVVGSTLRGRHGDAEIEEATSAECAEADTTSRNGGVGDEEVHAELGAGGADAIGIEFDAESDDGIIVVVVEGAGVGYVPGGEHEPFIINAAVENEAAHGFEAEVVVVARGLDTEGNAGARGLDERAVVRRAGVGLDALETTLD